MMIVPDPLAVLVLVLTILAAAGSLPTRSATAAEPHAVSVER